MSYQYCESTTGLSTQCFVIAHRVTNETYRWLSDARFHASGDKIVATKWYTSERSLGAGEAWEYDIPDSFDAKIEVGSGRRLVGRTLPRGWAAENYGDQQIGPEQFIWQGDDSLIYAKNVRDSSTFTYSKGMWDAGRRLVCRLIPGLQTCMLASTLSLLRT